MAPPTSTSLFERWPAQPVPTPSTRRAARAPAKARIAAVFIPSPPMGSRSPFGSSRSRNYLRTGCGGPTLQDIPLVNNGAVGHPRAALRIEAERDEEPRALAGWGYCVVLAVAAASVMSRGRPSSGRRMAGIGRRPVKQDVGIPTRLHVRPGPPEVRVPEPADVLRELGRRRGRPRDVDAHARELGDEAFRI